jgi:acyl transferase domain-containing protein
LSARTPEALQQRIAGLVAVLRRQDWDAAGLLRIAYTLLCGRQHFRHRALVVASSREEAIAGWERLRSGERELSETGILPWRNESRESRSSVRRDRPARFTVEFVA